MPSPTVEQKQAARTLLSMWASRKVGLPASFNDCMAFFTGYKDTRVSVTGPAAYIDLARRCIDYCDRLHDKESLHLLLYAVVRRVNESKPYLGPALRMFTLLDILVGDSAGLYQDNQALQVNDMALLFHAWLTYVEQDKKKLGNFKPTQPKKTEIIEETDDILHKRKVSVWHERFSIERKAEQAIPFTRGGGLYFFLDLLKGLSKGEIDDSDRLRGIYVTPEKRTNRDEFYAYDPSRGRSWFDKPSHQRGTIVAERLKGTNHNSYEGFIETKDVSDINDVKIELMSGSYMGKNHFILSVSDISEIEPFLPPASADLIKRAKQCLQLLRAPKEKIDRLRQEMMAENRLNIQIKPYIEKLNTLCRDYKEHLENSGKKDSAKYTVYEQFQSLLDSDDTRSASEIIHQFSLLLSSEKNLLSHQDAPVSSVFRGVGLVIAKSVALNQIYSDVPFFFFSSHGALLIQKAEELIMAAEVVIKSVCEEGNSDQLRRK